MCLCARLLVLEGRERAFIEKSELQMFLLISGGHIADISAPKRYTNPQYGVSLHGSTKVRETFRQITQKTVGHKDLRLGQIVYILVFYNISFS